MEVHDIIKDIKGKFRLFMNGVISQSMRDKGMDYKLIFGIEVPRLKEIAFQYEKNHDLAQALWKENIRECQILATMLQPVDTFYPEIAEIWIESMRMPEQAEQATMHLFQHLPYATDVVFQWIADERPYFQLCGYLLMARLFMKDMRLNERSEAEFLDQAVAAIGSEPSCIQKAASAALRKYGQQSRENARKVQKVLGALSQLSRPDVQSLVQEIKNDIE